MSAEDQFGECVEQDQIRELVKKAVATTDELDLQRTMSELRAALPEHIDRARQMALASYPESRPDTAK